MSNGRLILSASLPRGPAWDVKPGGNYDLMLDAAGEILDIVISKFASVGNVSIPSKTELLEDLERDFGILKNDALTEADRRVLLDKRVYDSIVTGNPETLEQILQVIDPGLHVYQNNPAVDPAPFINDGFIVISRGRGDTYGGVIPEEDWPLVWFVGGEATRDVDGKIISINEVVVPRIKESVIVTPLLSYKPLYTWCAAVLVVGTKLYICDAVGNNLVDALGRRIYALGE